MKLRYLSICLPLLAASAFSHAGGYTGPNGGAAGTAAGVINTAQAANQASDDARVVLEGTITHRLKGDNYEFRDASGTIKVEIDDDQWPTNVSVDDKQKVRLVGEVDVDSDGREVDVHRVEIVQ